MQRGLNGTVATICGPRASAICVLYIPLQRGGCIAMGYSKVLFRSAGPFCCGNLCALVIDMQLKAAGQCHLPLTRSITDACMLQKEPYMICHVSFDHAFESSAELGFC
jgi:hypothetical protein